MISAEQLRKCLCESEIEFELFDYGESAKLLNALIRPLIESAVASAQAEMRERCAAKMRTLNDEFWSAVAARDCESVPLSPSSDAWLRMVVDMAFAYGLDYADKWHRWVGSGCAPEKEPTRPTYESILAEAAKEKP